MKWNFEYLKSTYGDIEVPLYSDAYSNPGKGYMQPTCYKSLAEYIDLIQSVPTNLRMFLFNIFQKCPEMFNDIEKPTLMTGFVKGFPFMFFGGKGSEVKLHYDVDHSCVFRFFDNYSVEPSEKSFCKKLEVLIPMGFNPLIYKHLEQWVKTHWTINAEIVKEPVFLNQFEGTKKIILFALDQSKYLYHHPFTVKITH